MKIAVWETYVKRSNGTIIHFDILVPIELKDQETIFNFGKHYLNTKPFETSQLTANECRLCHIEQATESIIASIKKNGYAIIEMENCR